MTEDTTRSPRTHAALSLAADGRWTGDRESLRRQLAVVEAEAAEIENRRWLEQSAIAERSRAPAPVSESWLARGDHWLADGRLHDADTCPDENHAGDLHELLAAHHE